MLFGETAAVYCENHTEHKHTIQGFGVSETPLHEYVWGVEVTYTILDIGTR
jgi:hypothetical protein